MAENSEHELKILVADTMEFLMWIVARAGRPAGIHEMPLNFNSSHWMINHPTGRLYVSEAVGMSQRLYKLAVTPAGMNFLRENGWSAEETPAVSSTLTSVWQLDRQQQIYEYKDLSNVPEHVLEMLEGGNVAVVNGVLYATSKSDLLGFDEDDHSTVH